MGRLKPDFVAALEVNHGKSGAIAPLAGEATVRTDATAGSPSMGGRFLWR